MLVVMLLLTQYIIILSNSSSSVNFSVKPPSSRSLYAVLVHVLNFSKIYAASASGEAVTAVPNEQCYTYNLLCYKYFMNNLV